MKISVQRLAWLRMASPRAWPTLLLFACLVGLIRSASARAADSEIEPTGYRAAIDAAVQEYELNHFAESREHFARAHALYPNARTFRGLGVADFELRHYVDAVQELEAALGHSTKRLDGALREDTEQLLRRAREYVGEVQLTLEPPDATLLVDGQAVTLDATSRLMLEVGDHQLDVSAEGRAPQQRAVRVRGQQRLQLRIELQGTQPSGSSAQSGNDGAKASGRSPRRTRVFTWALGGLTLAAAGSVLGLAIAVENTQDSLDDCLAAGGVCQPVADQGRRLERARNAMIGVASAAAVATVVSFFVEGRKKSGAQVALRLTPTGGTLSAAF